MNISRIFIIRPVATVLFMVAIVISGTMAYRNLPISALPQVDYPTIQVSTFYPGAGPEVMTSSVTAPLERQFGQIPGLTQMTSTSSDGCSVITLRFALELNIDIAVQQVQAAINVAGSFLPRDLPNPPVYTKTNPADAPILTLALSSDTLPLARIQDLADTRLAQRISQVSGVGQVSVSGGQKPAIRIQVNPNALSSLGLTMDDVRLALVAANVNQAKGSFDGADQAVVLSANDQMLSSDEYRELIVTYRSGAPVTLKEVADIVDDVENVRQAAWMNDAPAVLLNIQRQPNANIIEVVDRVKGLLPQLRDSLPSAIDVQILTDRTTNIRASIKDVQFELMLTIGLVVLVIFLFLRDLRATLIPSVAVPLSLVGTFGVMYLLGYSLNNLTLMALTISTGFVVDDAIVMIENIMRYIEEGDSPLEASLRGSKEIAFTILSLSVSLVAVLIPLLFMSDIVGRLFREFAVTLSITILVSAVVSLTLTPMMCAKLLKSKHAQKAGWAYRASEWAFDSVIAFYGWTLRIVLRHQVATLAVAVGTLALTGYLYVQIPKGFFPIQDTGVILGISEGPQDGSFESMRGKQLQLNKIVMADPAVASLSSFIGIDGTNLTINSGRIQINLKPHEERHESAVEVIRRIQERADEVAGIRLFMQPVQDLSVETRVSRTQFQYTLETPDIQELNNWTTRLVTRLQEVPELRDVASDQQSRGLQANVVIDRDSASRLGVTPQTIDDALYNAFGQRQVTTMFTQLNQYRVILEVHPDFKKSPSDLSKLYVKVGPGQGQAQAATPGQTQNVAPLSAMTRIEERPTSLTINHQGQFPVSTISFNLAPGVSLGEAVKAMQIAQEEVGLPPSIIGSFQGTAEAFQKSLVNTPLLILAAIITVYIVLGILYESFVHPITILSTLPSAGVGALLALQWTHIDLNVIALIGIILLIGIVKKNAIMMIDFALDAQRNEGLSPTKAIYQAGLLRFRPIMMTTMAALLGGVPLAMGGGVGSELRQPLGITIIGGLIFSQMLTLYTTPVIYLWFEKLLALFKRGR